MNEKSMIRDLTVGNPLKQLLTFAIPFVLANLLQQVYNLADMAIVGQLVGSAGLSAASAGGEMAVLFLFTSTGISTAGQILISQHIGAGERHKIKNAIGTLVVFEFALAAVFMVFALCLCNWGIRVLNVPAEAVDYARDYAMTYFCGMIPVFGYNVVSSILRGMGDSTRPMSFVAIAAVLNIILDLLFVGLLGLACFGAALATVISQTVSFVVAVVYLYRRREAFGFDFKWKSFRIDPAEFRVIVKLGLPLAVQNCAIEISMLYISSLINDFGLVASAATAVGNKIIQITLICTSAMIMSGNSIVAQNFAAKKFRRVSATLGWILVVDAIFCSFLALMMILMPETIFSFFDKNPHVLEMSHLYVIPAVVHFVGCTTRAPVFALTNGIGFSRLSLCFGLTDGNVARIGLSLLLGVKMGMGVVGIWLGSALAGNIIGVMGLIYYLMGTWKKRKPLS